MAVDVVADLVHRWDQIQEVEESETDDTVESDFRRLKERWFIEAFKHLQNAPKEKHCWCTFEPVMFPLLEPFSFYFDLPNPQSDLHALWRRLCSELSECVQCVLEHHKAKEKYKKDYHEVYVEPLLAALQALDEGRVAFHLKTLLNLVQDGKFDSEKHTTEVITVMFEVLMFPTLLEDAEVSELFAPFLQYVEDTHDLTLAKGPQYPGVYTLLVHSDQKVRRVAFKLVQSLEMIKDAHEIEAIAPLLEKIMHCLEFEDFEPETSGAGQKKLIVGQKKITQSSYFGKLRPRVRFKREILWLGLPNILERLQPAALLDGIVERYSVFVSIVLNHVSETTPRFFHALKCLELLLSNLGYEFWLRTTFSAGVVRNTLVSQCFHSDKQQMHKSIFELFPPFLLSLETLQDDYERQRRRLLYFLLQQVPASKNFTPTMRWKARQVSFKIIYRGYTMEPPLPPWECAHVWGPPLVATLKDPLMHDAFRSAAFDLIQTILAADTSALASFPRKSEGLSHPWSHTWENGNDESGCEVRAAGDGSHDQEYWKILKKVSDTVSDGLEKWSCVPLLWIEVLGGVLAYPTSFYKSVLWAYGRIAIVDPPGNMNVLSPGIESKVLRWETPKGYDDQSDSDVCVNVVPVQQHYIELISTFRSHADGFLGRLGTVLHYLTLESWFAEPLLLLLMSSNNAWREVAQKVLDQSSTRSSLESGLKLLYSNESSVSAVCDAVRHASNTFLNWPLANCERSLSQLFFLGLKLLSVKQGAPETMGSEGSSTLQKLWATVSTILWPLVGRKVMDSKHLIGGNHEVMLTRMLQLLPYVCKHMPISFQNEQFGVHNPSRNSINWFPDLLALGSLASGAVLRWWQNAACAIVENLVQSGSLSLALKGIISDLLQPGCPLDEDQQRRLKFLLESASGSISHTRSVDSRPAQYKATNFVGSGGLGSRSMLDVIDLDSEDDNDVEDRCRRSNVKVVDPNERDRDVIDLERLDHVTSALSGVSVKDQKELDSKAGRTDKDEEMGEAEDMEDLEEMEDEEEMEETEDPADSIPLASLLLKPQSVPPPRIVHSQRRKPGGNKLSTLDNFVYKTPKPSTERPAQKKRTPLFPRPRAIPSVSKNQVNLEKSKQPVTSKEQVSAGKQPILVEAVQNSRPQVISLQDTLSRLAGHAARESAVLRELVMDDDDDMLTKALNAARKLSSRDGAGREKRQMMTLQMPGEQIRPGSVTRPVPERAPPPKMDMWFRQMLSMDYFLTVGLECLWIEDRHVAASLIKVPLTFPSVEKYKEVFQPLLMEEFKAQLQQSFGEISLSDGKTCAVLRLMSLERVDDFQIGRFLAYGEEHAARTWVENDLLLLTRYRLKQNESQSCHILAKVDRKPEREFRGSTTTILLKFCMPQGNSRLQNAKKYLLVRSEWHMTRVMNLSPQLREFQALSAVGDLPLLKTILCASNSEKTSIRQNVTVGLKGLTSELGSRFKADYNESQVSAIAAAVGKHNLAEADHQLALVQGPPGTGKTRTIVGIVSALLSWEPQSTKVSEKNNQRVFTDARGGASVRSSTSSSVALSRVWQDAALAKEMSGGMENLSGRGKENDTTINRGGSRKRRILVCAQSNAAVDELVARLCKDGLYGKHGDFFRPLLVRVGNVKSVHPASMEIFIDTLVEKRLAAEKSTTHVEENRQQKTVLLRRKLEEVIESIQVLEASHAKRGGGDIVSKDALHGQTVDLSGQAAQEVLAAPADKKSMDPEVAKRVERVVQEGESAVQGKLNTLHKQRRQLSTELANAEKEEKKLRGEEWAKRQEMRRAVIREADVVLTTLNGSGADVYNACMETFVPGKKFQRRKDVPEDDFFSAVVIDEAGQALEPATLIPLQLLKQTYARCVMVGDPKQLPATVLSQLASKMDYETSMFERLQRAGHPVTVLTTQYRMHPEIRQFPSAHFYDNQLTDGEGLAEGFRKAPFHNEWCFAPYVFFDVVDGCEQTAASQSLYNNAEAVAALSIYRTLQQRYPKEANSRSFSVITPYKQQLKVVQERFSQSLGSAKVFNIEFNTVDGYQGREVDILILSTVRASGTVGRGNIGFVADVRRMNVALTRARFSLWIVGNAATLQQNSNWAALLSDAKMRQTYFPVKYPYAFQEDATLKIRRPASLPPGLYSDRSKGNEASAGAHAEHITVPRVSELGSVNANPTENAGREHVSSETREGIDLVSSASPLNGVEDTLQENEITCGVQTVKRDTSKQSQQRHGKRSESTTSDERRTQKSNSFARGERDKQFRSRATRNDIEQDRIQRHGKRSESTTSDERRTQKSNSFARGERDKQFRSRATRNDIEQDRIQRQHPDGIRPLPSPKSSDEHYIAGQKISRFVDGVIQDFSSRSREEVDSRRKTKTDSTGIHNMAEARHSERAHAMTSENRARRTVVGKAAVNKDSTAPSSRASPRTTYVDFTSGRLEKSSIESDRSNNKRLERDRPSSHYYSGRSIAGVSSATSLLNSGQRTDTRPDSHRSASVVRDAGPRPPPGHRSRNSPYTTSSSVGERDLYMRTPQGNTSVRVGSGEQVEICDSHRRTEQAVKTDSYLLTRVSEKPAGKSAVESRIKQVRKSGAVRSNDQRSVHPPDPKRQKIAGGSSVMQGIAPSSTVDDILSGLGSLSRSQVIGSKGIDQSLTNQNTTRRL